MESCYSGIQACSELRKAALTLTPNNFPSSFHHNYHQAPPWLPPSEKARNQAAFSSLAIRHCPLVPVGVRLVRSFALDTNVVCLLLRQCCELCTKSRKVKPSHLLIQLLGQEVPIILVLLLCQIFEKIK